MNKWSDNDNHIVVQLLKIKLKGHRNMGGRMQAEHQDITHVSQVSLLQERAPLSRHLGPKDQ